MLSVEKAASSGLRAFAEDKKMIKALFWCFTVLAAQLWMLHWVDRRVMGMRFGEYQAPEALPEEARPEE